MPLTKDTLLDLNSKLLTEKERIESELSCITKPSLSSNRETIFNEIGTDEDENATEVEEYTDNLAIENTLEKQLEEINAALIRIKQNSYGKCEICGFNINIERLKVYPSAKKCTLC